MCHGELARRRPTAGHLTVFYMWMSAGGVVGGIAAALIAPYAFSWVAEYPILIVLAILCRPGLTLADRRQTLLVAAAFVVAAAIIVVPAVGFDIGLTDAEFYWGLAGAAGAGAGGIAVAQPPRLCRDDRARIHGLAFL